MSMKEIAVSQNQPDPTDMDVFLSPPLIDSLGPGAGPFMVRVRPDCSKGVNSRWLIRIARGLEVETPCTLDNKEVEGLNEDMNKAASRGAVWLPLSSFSPRLPTTCS
jgi:hypothetical protein